MIGILVALRSILDIEAVAGAMDALNAGMNVAGLFKYLRSKVKRNSIEDQIIFAIDESLKEACKKLGWGYDDLAVSQLLEPSQLLNHTAMTKEELGRLLSVLVGTDIKGKELDVIIDCFDKSVADNEELHRYLDLKWNRYIDEASSSVDFRAYYELVEKRFTSKKRGSQKRLVGEYSDEEAYIETYLSVDKIVVPALSYLEKWFKATKSRTMLLYGEPGQGKSTLCDKAVVEYIRGNFLEDKAKNVITILLNTDNNRRIIKDKKADIEAVLSWGIGKTFTFEDCRGALLFMDGFDEFIDEAKQAGITDIVTFMKRIDAIAFEYDIHIVVLSRTIAVSSYLNERTIKEKSFEIMPITKEQQDDWFKKHKEYDDYRETFRSIRDDVKMRNLLGIPFLFRMIVNSSFDRVNTNVVELYDRLTDHLLEKRNIYGIKEKEQVISGLCELAYSIYCNDANTVTIPEKQWDTRWVFAFYIKQIGTNRIGFFHRSFYQYFLAKYVYYQVLNIGTDEQAEILIGALAERELDDVVRQYLSLMINEDNRETIYNNLKLVIEALVRTEAYLNLEPRYATGTAEKKKLGRARNAYRNTIHISAAFSYVIEKPFREGIDDLIRTYPSSYITICSIENNRANLSGADLSGADLSRTDLRGATLSAANLRKVDLREAELSGTDLREAELNGADLREAELSRTDLRGAALSEANLRNADLREVELSGADLSKANLRGANLSKSNLSRVDLRGADLSGADLSGVDLSEAKLQGAVLREANLRGANLRTDLRGVDLSGADLSAELKEIDPGEKLNSFFQKYHDKCPTFLDLQQFVEEEKSDELQNYIHTELDDLYRFAEAQNIGRRAGEVQELLELLWKLYLIDSDRIKKIEVSDVANVNPSADADDETKVNTTLPIKDSGNREEQKSLKDNDDKEEQYKPKPSDLENATDLVLKDFEEWWGRKADREGLTFSIEKHTVRQASGLQFGYDVGLNTRYGGLKYRLRFECKNYTSNIPDSEQDKTTELPVSRYAYNLLEYYMECKSEVNMRWVLICPFGGLQNDFPERLFEHWNEDHTFIKIYAIMENGPTLTCKDFLSVNDDAYRLVYKKDYDGDLTKDDVFEKLFKEIVGTDDVREVALKRLEKYTFWKEYGGHKGLLPVPDSKSQIALEQIISFLQKKENTDEERKRMLFVIGEYGTGKSWLCYRAIEQIVLHPSDFPFMPFFLRLKDLSQKKDLEDMTQYKDIMQETLGDFFEKYNGWAGECVKKDHQPIFFLDGFDEVFSGLSATDKKIDFLLSIIGELNDWYEGHEITREIKKHTKPFFVITSRESDFEVGMKSENFQQQMDQAEVIELELCSVEEVQNEWNKLEEEDHIDRSWIFKLDQNSAFLNIIRRPVFYRLCSDALKVAKFKQKVELASVDEVDVLDMLFEYELQNYARGEGLDKNEIRKEIYRCAVKCSKDKISQVVYEGKSINQIIHVGMVKIKKDQDVEGTCWISFEHNIVREYLTARYLSQSLIDCSIEKTEDPLETAFVKDLQELPLTPEALKFLLLCIEKKSLRDKGERYKKLIKKWLSDKSIKSLNSRLPARLLEILLQPGHTLSGEKNEMLDLSGLHASDLCLWNCGMRHVNLSQAELRNWQMINLELDDVDLRGANMEGLRVAPDKPISSFCYWKDTKEWHVAALHENGQLMQYNFPDNSWKQYSAEVLSKNGVNDGMFRFNKELMLYSVNKLFDEKGNELYQIRSSNELDRIVTASGFCGVLTKQGNKCQATVFRGDTAPIAFSFGETKPKYLILTENGQVIYVRGSSINIVFENGEARKICDWANDYECFATRLDPVDEACLYIKCGDRLIHVALNKEMNEITAFRKELHIQGELETMRELRVLNETALAAVGKNELYILSIEKNKDVEEVKSRKLKTAIVISNTLLEDKDGRNRVQDEKAYELLCSSMC